MEEEAENMQDTVKHEHAENEARRLIEVQKAKNKMFNIASDEDLHDEDEEKGDDFG